VHTGLLRLAELAEYLANEGSRLKKRAAIAEAITKVHAESAGDAGLFAQYLAGLPFPEADPRKLNAGGALLSNGVLAVSGAVTGTSALPHSICSRAAQRNWPR
jgi:DNA ligase-1